LQIVMTSNVTRVAVMAAGSCTALAGIVEAITALAGGRHPAETPPS
jgi:hypothetical protein